MIRYLRGISGGHTLVEEALSLLIGGIQRCQTFIDVIDVVTYLGLRYYLGATADSVVVPGRPDAAYIIIHDNPLEKFVELPPLLADTFQYSIFLAGVIQGCMEAMHIVTQCDFVEDENLMSKTILVTLVDFTRDDKKGGNENI
eukprot:GHVH01003911.1.p1 GENE.GHVH01003911.1~~GHVH01003911.1.p1  ORF type:complete len:143 (+),score=15.73 GHVH01003911.1:236-664(+)